MAMSDGMLTLLWSVMLLPAAPEPAAACGSWL